MKKMSLKDISMNDFQRPTLGKEIPVTTFRLLRLVGIQEILGDSAGPILYMTGKNIGNGLSIETTNDFIAFIIENKIGIPEIEIVDSNNLIIRVGECMTCSGLPNIDELICHFESGLIAGALEKIFGRPTKSTQTKGISHGDSYCQFEVFLY